MLISIIALFTAGDSIWLRDLAEMLPQASDLGERLGACFTRLVVPRKEREKIQMLLSLWSRVRDTPVRDFKPGAYRRSALLPELLGLLEVACLSREDIQRLHLLKSLLSDEAAGHHDNERHDRYPNHRRR